MDEAVPRAVGEHVHDSEERANSRRVNRKLDIALLPFLSLLYLFNGLDRSNIGNAETQGALKPSSQVLRNTNQQLGFSRDIGATPDDLNLAISLFFITFVILQPPSAAVGRWLGAKHWISILMVHTHGIRGIETSKS
jgi:hypothetical protein